MGGDGTLLHVANLFQNSCPPVLSFSMGSLGFLTPFDFKFHEKVIQDVLSGNVSVLLRTRLNCSINKEKGDKSSSSDSPINDDDASHHALNEVVIDRGPNSYLSNLDLYINGRFITKIQGDGKGKIINFWNISIMFFRFNYFNSYWFDSLCNGWYVPILVLNIHFEIIIAGASMVHPSVPALVICPVCPHSLSFRPIVVPAGIELTVKVSEDTRLTAWLSVDGRNRHELKQGNW